MRKMKLRCKRMLAGFLAAVTMAASIPPSTVFAAPEETESNAEYDYARMVSLEERYKNEIAIYYPDTGMEEQIDEMMYGEFTAVEFAFPYNTNLKAELYLVGSETPLGYLYGISNRDHVSKTGAGTMLKYVSNNWSEDTIFKNLDNGILKSAEYQTLSSFEGIALDGITNSYTSLKGYYAFYGLEDPELMEDEPGIEASAVPEEKSGEPDVVDRVPLNSEIINNQKTVAV